MRDRGVAPWPWWTEVALLVAVAGGLVWAVSAGERDTSAYLAMGAWVLVLGLALPRSTPEAPAWVLALTAAGSAAAAVGLFRLYQWAGWPVMGYVDAISTGLVALLALVSLWVKSSPGPSGSGRSPAAGFAADAEPGAAPDRRGM